jgi:hypothetical protein
VPQLTLRVVEQDGDAERLDVFARHLHQRLEELDDVEVSPAASGELLPQGARGVGVDVVGALLVTVSDIVAHLAPIVAAIQEWLHRTPELPRIVRLELDGDAIEISNASAAEEQRLVELFVARHAGRR